jgi:hypothetical protein
MKAQRDLKMVETTQWCSKGELSWFFTDDPDEKERTNYTIKKERQGVTTVRANQPPKWPTKWTITVLHCSMWDKKIMYANELEALAAMKNLWGHTVTIHRQSDKILYWLTWAQKQRMSKLKYQTIWHFCLIWCIARHEHCCKRDPSNSLQK